MMNIRQIRVQFETMRAKHTGRSSAADASALAAAMAAPAPVRQEGTDATEIGRLLRSIRDERTDSAAFREGTARLRALQTILRARGAALAEVLS